ncbi:MAG: tRNA uridine(34) 5-carboxymethylaminomethyl modification radical SAM/GNAT enzyme Elp3 [Candidatus Nanoarchaeia archaeon]|nr:tRNA uridine(34) 5-carboxymethylaminomethyl modification radical SAM/GNAT enzyme Elp3 [Candidatus Nanoarchaeia archaeon]
MKIPNKDEIRKPTKTLAGVTPIAVMAKPKKCRHGTCLYCPSLNVPQSYTPKSPPVLRAERLRYDPYEQIKSRLKAFKLMNHPTDKIELIVMGGNFLEYPLNYQNNFIKRCYDALNNRNSKNLNEAKKINELAEHRCVALCIETRPDTINEKEIKKILDFGCTRVELGVQCLDDSIYKKINRGHGTKEVVEATRLLKNSGFKIGFHMMLGLPYSNPKKDFQMFKELFKNPDFKPDQLKIYPCQVIKGAELEKLYKKGKYKPYSKEQVESLVIKIMKIIPNYCRVMRIMREIPPDYLTAGILRIDLRKDIDEKLKLSKTKIKETRFREIGFELRDSLKKINRDLRLKITEYKASNGKEYFLEIVNKNNILFGLCRLRIFQNKDNKSEAFVRELHVYGPSLSLKEKSRKAFQHRGLGKQLMKKAEEITKENKLFELKVISGIGVRKYYEKLSYKLDKNKVYMIKRLF